MPTGDLQNLRVIVTGGASGMGEATVCDLVRHGAAVVSLDLNPHTGAQAKLSETDGGCCSFLRCDVSDERSVREAFEQASEMLGGLDGLVHAAGIAPGESAEDLTTAAWDKVFAVNARGTFLTNQAAFSQMRRSGGRIINFASAAGLNGYPGKAAYAASKGAVLAWTRTVAREWGRYGITVNAIVPAIATPMYLKTRSLMTVEQLAALDARLAAELPLGGKLGDPDQDLAPVLRFYLGKGARFITGQTIAVDGGLVMVR